MEASGLRVVGKDHPIADAALKVTGRPSLWRRHATSRHAARQAAAERCGACPHHPHRHPARAGAAGCRCRVLVPGCAGRHLQPLSHHPRPGLVPRGRVPVHGHAALRGRPRGRGGGRGCGHRRRSRAPHRGAVRGAAAAAHAARGAGGGRAAHPPRRQPAVRVRPRHRAGGRGARGRERHAHGHHAARTPRRHGAAPVSGAPGRERQAHHLESHAERLRRPHRGGRPVRSHLQPRARHQAAHGRLLRRQAGVHPGAGHGVPGAAHRAPRQAGARS